MFADFVNFERKYIWPATLLNITKGTKPFDMKHNIGSRKIWIYQALFNDFS